MSDEYVGPLDDFNTPTPIQYTWEILNLQTQSVGNTQNIIVRIEWKKTGTLNGISASFTGSSEYPVSRIDTGVTYKPIEEVTQDDVIQWAKNTIYGEYEKAIDMSIERQISEHNNPVVSIELPWSKANTESNL
jgi:hypothetical protein